VAWTQQSVWQAMMTRKMATADDEEEEAMTIIRSIAMIKDGSNDDLQEELSEEEASSEEASSEEQSSSEEA
jgi:hypothetical protein